MANQKKKTNSKTSSASKSKKSTTTNSKKGSTAKKNTTREVEEKVSAVNESKREKVVKGETTTTASEVKPVTKSKKSFSLSSKQRDIILVILVLIVFGIALVFSIKPYSLELPVALEGTAGYNEITYSEYEQKVANDELFLVVIVKDGCPYCEAYEPIVKEVADEYAIPINFINLSHLTTDESSALDSSNSYLRTNQWGTPTTLFMYGKNVVDYISQYVEKDELVDFVEKNFVVAKDGE